MSIPCFSVPIEPPNNVQILNLTAVSATVTWTPLPKSSLKGKFTKYAVKLMELDTEKLTFHDTKKRKFKIVDLNHFTRYSIQVAACNSEGDGPFSPHVHFKTHQSGILNKWKNIYRYHGLYLMCY